jgi:hypothetical protein
MQEWAEVTRVELARQRALVWTLRSKTVGEVFVEWRKVTGTLAQRAAAVRAISKMRHAHTFEMYIQHWAVLTRWRKWCRSNIAVSTEKVSRSLARLAFSGWFEYLKVARLGKQLAADTAYNIQKHYWTIMYTTHSKTLALHARMKTVLRRWALMEVSMAMHHWSNLCRLKRKILLIVGKHLQGSTQFYFEFWAGWTVKMQNLAAHTAARFAACRSAGCATGCARRRRSSSLVVVDGFAGVGGNAIQFALAGHQVSFLFYLPLHFTRIMITI